MSHDNIEKCPICGGTGLMSCPNCGGSGIEILNNEVCKRCSGTGKVECKFCADGPEKGYISKDKD